jgi:hypothetical protein
MMATKMVSLGVEPFGSDTWLSKAAKDAKVFLQMRLMR